MSYRNWEGQETQRDPRGVGWGGCVVAQVCVGVMASALLPTDLAATPGIQETKDHWSLLPCSPHPEMQSKGEKVGRDASLGSLARSYARSTERGSTVFGGRC